MWIEERRLLVWENEGGATRRDDTPATPERTNKRHVGAKQPDRMTRCHDEHDTREA